MAGTETNNDFDEFIVDSSKLTLVNDIQNKVERMFSINIYVDESTDNNGEKSWLRVDGQKCDRKDARVMLFKGSFMYSFCISLYLSHFEFSSLFRIRIVFSQL